MQNKLTMQESASAHKAWKTQQRQKKRKTPNRGGGAYKGINEVIEIKKLDTIEEFKQKQQVQSAEDEASVSEMKETNLEINQPADPTNAPEFNEEPMNVKNTNNNIELEQSSVEKTPVT